MEEKILTGKKNGMVVLLGVILGYVAAVIGVIITVQLHWYAFGFARFLLSALMVFCILYLALGWILLCGLRVLKPQEALVLTLFGK